VHQVGYLPESCISVASLDSEVLRIRNEIIARMKFALENYFIKAIPINSIILIDLANHVTNSVSYLDVKYGFHRINFLADSTGSKWVVYMRFCCTGLPLNL